MCGRYVSTRRAAELAAHFGAADTTADGVAVDFNVAPTKAVPAVVPAGGTSGDARALVLLRWGLVPSWSKDRRGAARMINARMETVATKPAFRSALQRRRALLPADGFYEWQRQAGRSQPYFIHPADGAPLAFAGLHEAWRDPDTGEWLRTCTIVTADAPDSAGRLHDRAPLTVPPELWASWLDPGVPPPLGELRPAIPGPLLAVPVGPEVGNVRNNGPGLITPLPQDGAGVGPR